MPSVLTQKDQTLDEIVFQAYGLNPQMLGPVNDANPHLAGRSLHLPAGLSVSLPELSTTPKPVKTVNLWD